MHSLIHSARRILGRVPQPAAPADETSGWIRAFTEVFDTAPDPEQARRLEFLARGNGNASARQRYRAVLAAFDQQVLGTGFTVRWSRDDVVLRQVHGISMYLDRTDISVAQVIEAGNYEPHLLAFIDEVLQPGMHFIDAGANIGLFTLLAAAKVGPSGKVLSFEPNSENCRLLLSSAAANGFTNISLYPVALGNESGYVYFTSALGSNGGIQDDLNRDLLAQSCKIVPVMRLDDVAPERVDVLKMDVEGAEALLVEGAVETLRRCRPIVVSEFSYEMLHRVARRDGNVFLESLQQQGFELFVSDKQSRKLRPLGDVRKFVSPFIGTGHIEDLVFCPAEKVATLPLRE